VGKENVARAVSVRVSEGEEKFSVINTTVCHFLLDDIESQCQKCRINTIGLNGQSREYYFC
jgi:hypothetical protein